MEKEQGLRYNEGKLRYDLTSPIAIKGLVEVLTKGAVKYAPRNWEKGMSWTTVLASMKRHLAAIEAGEDYDPETGCLHIDNLQCNAHFLSDYYRTHPEFDDRPKRYLKTKNIGLDIDDVIADFQGAWCERFKEEFPIHWAFGYNTSEKFKVIEQDKDFWMNIKPLIKSEDLKFEPHCYVTARNMPKEWIYEWLDKNRFPSVPLYVVARDASKMDIIKNAGCDVFVDDKYKTFVELNNAGICCFLFDSSHNRKYDVGYKRIKSLNELSEKI